MKKKITKLAIIISCFAVSSCLGEFILDNLEDSGPSNTGGAIVEFVSLYDGMAYQEDENIPVNVTAEDPDGVKEVTLWVNNNIHSVDKTAPYTFSVANLNIGSHKFHVTVKDLNGNITTGQKITVKVEACNTG